MFAAGGTWADVTVAAAFVVGVVVGGFAIIRVTRNAIEYLRDDRRTQGGDDAGTE